MPRQPKGIVNFRFSNRDKALLKYRANQAGKTQSAVVRALLQMPIKSDSIALKFQPLFNAADLYRASIDSIRLYQNQLNPEALADLKKKTIGLREKLLAEIDLLRAYSAVGRLTEK